MRTIGAACLAVAACAAAPAGAQAAPTTVTGNNGTIAIVAGDATANDIAIQSPSGGTVDVGDTAGVVAQGDCLTVINPPFATCIYDAGDTVFVTLGDGDDRIVVNDAFASDLEVDDGTGGDDLDGGGGDDLFTGGAGPGDVFDGDAGEDSVDYTRATPVTLSLDDVANDGGLLEGDDVHSDIEVLRGGDAGDTLVAAGTGGTLAGDPGDDTFRAGAASQGPDAFVGDAGEDSVDYSLRNTFVFASVGGGADDGALGEADDIGGSVENIAGGQAGAVLTGDGDANRLTGGADQDVLTGGPGADTLTGGAHVDTFEPGAGQDSLLAADGVGDLVDCAGGGPDSGQMDTAPPETYLGDCDADDDGRTDFFDLCPAVPSAEQNGCPPAPPVTAPPPTSTTPVAKKCKKAKGKKRGKKKRGCRKRR